jgi:hypothetical protein
MRNPTHILVLAATAVAISACATTAPDRQAAAYDTPPRLVGCGSEDSHGPHWVAVRAEFTVDERGRVLPASIRTEAPTLRSSTATERGQATPEWAVSATRDRLVSCTFEPALKDGEPVAATTDHRLRIPRPGTI